MPPAATALNVPDCRLVDAKERRYFRSWFARMKNDANLVFRELGARIFLPVLGSAVSNAVLLIFGLCSPAQIRSHVVSFVAIPVRSYVLGRGARPMKGSAYKDVNVAPIGAWGVLQKNRKVAIEPVVVKAEGVSASKAVRSLRRASHAPLIADLIRPAVNSAPFFRKFHD